MRIMVRVNENKHQREIKLPNDINIEQWATHFRSLNHSLRPDHSYETFGTFPHHPELDEPITTEDVQQTLKRMKNGKSPGLDGIPIEIYKALPTQMWYYIDNGAATSSVYTKPQSGCSVTGLFHRMRGGKPERNHTLLNATIYYGTAKRCKFMFKFKFKVHLPSVMEDEYKHIKTNYC